MIRSGEGLNITPESVKKALLKKADPSNPHASEVVNQVVDGLFEQASVTTYIGIIAERMAQPVLSKKDQVETGNAPAENPHNILLTPHRPSRIRRIIRAMK